MTISRSLLSKIKHDITASATHHTVV